MFAVLGQHTATGVGQWGALEMANRSARWVLRGTCTRRSDRWMVAACQVCATRRRGVGLRVPHRADASLGLAAVLRAGSVRVATSWRRTALAVGEEK
jgi:hypothetical protein